MSIRYKNALTYGYGFNITAKGPVDSRLIVDSVSDLTSVWGVDAPAYQGMIVSVLETGTAFILNGEDASVLDNWSELGSGTGSVTAENYSAAKVIATAENIGQLVYVLNDEVIGEDTYAAGPYVVSGAGLVSKLGTTSATGDIEGDVTNIKNEVTEITQEITNVTQEVTNITQVVNVTEASGLEKAEDGSLQVKVDASEDNALQATAGGLKVVIPEVVVPEYSIQESAETTEGYFKTYELTKDGVAVEGASKINIPNQLVVQGGTVKEVTEENVPYEGAKVGDLYLELLIANQDTPVCIPVNKLTDVYTADGVFIKLSDGEFSLDYNALKASLDAEYDAIGSAEAVKNELSVLIGNKVEAEEGKGLSANDFDDTLKAKLDSVEDNAQVNKIESIKLGGVVLSIAEDKSVDIDLTSTLEPYAKSEEVNQSLAAKLGKEASVNGKQFGQSQAVTLGTSDINLSANIGTDTNPDRYTTTDSIHGVLDSMNARIESIDADIQAAISGGVTGIEQGNGIVVDSSIATKPKIAVKTVAGSAIQATAEGLDLFWSELS